MGKPKRVPAAEKILAGSVKPMLGLIAMLAASSCATAPGALATQPDTTPADAKRVLVVINQNDPDSLKIGSYYLQKRQIPKANVVMINTTTADNISQDEYKRGILQPVQGHLAKSKSAIDFIVLTKGVPIRLQHDGGYSVDGHLAGMDLNMAPMGDVAQMGDKAEAEVRRCLNPYFNKSEPFSHAKYKLYLVTRLDGYTVDDAKKLVDNSLASKSEKGPFFFDKAGNRNDGGYGEMQKTLDRAHAVMQQKGYESSLDTSTDFIAPTSPLEGYASWGSNDGAFNLDKYKAIRFKPGALCETFVSTSGRTFRPTTGGQSLIADLIRSGVTGVKGYVSEPYTIALARPDILFDRYTSGYNLAESFYMASPVILWKDVVVGDPLCSPYGKR
jgi:uncharacterized protein (TIGR03790 family)